MTKEQLLVCGWCGEEFVAARTGRPAKYCSPSHRNRAYQQARADRSTAALVELSDEILALDSTADTGAVIAALNELRIASGLKPVEQHNATTKKAPKKSRSTVHAWAVWRHSVDDPAISVKYSTHTTANAAGAACRRLEKVWAGHQQRNIVEHWRWEPGPNNDQPGLNRADADIAARRMIPTELAPLSNDLRDQLIVRRATDRPDRIHVGRALGTNAERLLGLETGGTVTWEIDPLRPSDWRGRHPYTHELLDALCGPFHRIDRPRQSTTRNAIAERLATEILDPAGPTWELAKVDLRQWLYDNNFIDQPTEHHTTQQ